MYEHLLQLAGGGLDGRDTVLTGMRPSRLAQYLEFTWGTQRTPLKRRALRGDEGLQVDMARPILLDPFNRQQLPQREWPHLIYAFLLENTRLLDIFRRVIFEWTHGEALPRPSGPTQQWIHATERLFFTDPMPDGFFAITSSIRPDRAAVRRNAYWRMFGWDLQHGVEGGGRYPYVQGSGSNAEFGQVFEALLVHVWRAYANRNNQNSENATDGFAIDELVRKLREMLGTRRTQGTLEREEFDAVATMAWLLFAIDDNTLIVQDLDAEAEGTADRLKRIGQMVGVAAHARTDAFIAMALPASRILMEIEAGAVAANDLYTDAGPHTQRMLALINHWTIATGRNIKDPTVNPSLPVVIQAADRLRSLQAPTAAMFGTEIRAAQAVLA